MDFRRRRRGPRRLTLILLTTLLLVGGKLLFDRCTTTVSGAVLDEYSEQPVAGALVQWEQLTTTTEKKGQFLLVGVDGGRSTRPLTISAKGYETAEIPITWSSLDVRLRPNVLSGAVVSQAGQPVPGAWVAVGETEATTDADGFFELGDIPRDPQVGVGAPGYRPVVLQPGRDLQVEVRLEPLVSYGLYLGFGYLAQPQQREAIVRRGRELGLNTLVVDVKSDRGFVHTVFAPPESLEAGASTLSPEDLPEFLRGLRNQGWYLIARLVVFKDNLIAQAHPDLAIMTRRGLYVDCEGQRWLDPFKGKAWEYNLELAERAAKAGFQEVQFDYTRFPSDCVSEPLQYAQEVTPKVQQQTIQGFLELARKRLHALGVATSVDVFGLTTVEEDIGIGQVIEGIAKHVDYVSPMVYPSTWRPGSFGSDYPPAEPYRIVHLSVKRAVERLKELPARVRPWLQAYNDYQRRGLPYSHEEIVAQINATKDAGAPGWLLWDPYGLYPARGNIVQGH